MEFHTFLRLILTPRWQSRNRDNRAPNAEHFCLVYSCDGALSRIVNTGNGPTSGTPNLFPLN